MANHLAPLMSGGTLSAFLSGPGDLKQQGQEMIGDYLDSSEKMRGVCE